MKKLLIILLLLISYNTYSQGLTLNGSLNSSSVQGTGLCNSTSGNSFLNVPAVTYNARAKDFFARVTAAGKTLTDAQKAVYNNAFVRLASNGIIGVTRATDKINMLYLFPLKLASDSTVANMNILADIYNCIHYGVVTYTDSGVVGNGITGCLNTNFIPSSDSTICKLASFGIGFYSKTNMTGAIRTEIGVSSGVGAIIQFILRYSNNYYYAAINQAATVTGYTVSSTLGFFFAQRINSTTKTMYINGDSVLSVSENQGALPTLPITILARSGTIEFSTALCFSAMITSTLTSIEADSLNVIINDCAKEFGYNVY